MSSKTSTTKVLILIALISAIAFLYLSSSSNSSSSPHPQQTIVADVKSLSSDDASPTTVLMNSRVETQSSPASSSAPLEPKTLIAAKEAEQKQRRANTIQQPSSLSRSSFSRFSTDKTSPFCFYQVTNVCVHHPSGTLQLHEPLLSSNLSLGEASTRKFRLCNELRKKFHLGWRPMMQNNNNEKSLLQIKSSSQIKKKKTMQVATCWQFYGYHLFQCSVAVFYAMKLSMIKTTTSSTSSSEVVDVADDLYLYNHAASMPKVSRDHYSHKMYLGSSSSWLISSSSSSSSSDNNDSRRDNNLKRILDAPLWGLWAANAFSPENVHELFPTVSSSSTASKDHYKRQQQKHTTNNDSDEVDGNVDETMMTCYENGIIGQPVHHTIPNEVRLEHVQKLKRIFLNRKTSSVDIDLQKNKKKKKSILISQRGAGSKQGSRKIANLDQILKLPILSKKNSIDDTKQFLLFEKVTVVDFATLRFDEQMKLADEADIFISTHGAGNIWLAFLNNNNRYHVNKQQQERNSSSSSSSSPLFIELWPQDTVARDVYRTMCSQYGVRYRPIFAKMKPLFTKPEEVRFSFLHQDVEVPLRELEEVLRSEV